MKLYDIPRGSKIKLPITDDKGKDLGEQECTFNFIDGMYSNISMPDGHPAHLAAYADLTEKDGIYELAQFNNNSKDKADV